MAIYSKSTGQRMRSGDGTVRNNRASSYQPWAPSSIVDRIKDEEEQKSSSSLPTFDIGSKIGASAPQLQFEEATEVKKRDTTPTRIYEEATEVAPSYDKEMSRLESLRKQAAVDLDTDTVNVLEKQMKNLRAKTNQQTVGDRASDVLSSVLSGSASDFTNLAGFASNAYSNPERDQRTIERLQSALDTGVTSDGQKLSDSQRKVLESRISELQQHKSEAESEGSLTNRIYRAADRMDDDSAKFQDKAKQGLGAVGSTVVDAATAFGQSALTGIAGAATGTGMAPFVAQAFGGAAQSSRREGANFDEQFLYGGSQAAKEYITEKLFGFAVPQKIAGARGSFDDVIEKGIRNVTERLAKTNAGQKALGGVLTWLAGGVTESLEEGIGALIDETIINPNLRDFAPDTRTTQQKFEDGLYEMLIGGVSGLLGVTNLASYSPSGRTSGPSTVDTSSKTTYNKPVETVSPAASSAVKQTAAQAENTQLQNPESDVLDAATTAWMGLGMNLKTAKQRAEITKRLIAGEEVSVREINKLDPTNKEAQKVFSELTGVQFPDTKMPLEQTYNLFRSASTVAQTAQMAQEAAQERSQMQAAERAKVETEIAQMGAEVAQAVQERAPKTDPAMARILNGERVDQTQLSAQSFDALAERGDVAIDAKGRAYQMRAEDHIDQRTQESVAPKGVNAFSFDHPELHDYMVQVAEALIADADISQSMPMGRRYERTMQGNKVKQEAQTSQQLRKAMDETGLTRSEIIDAAQRIVRNGGQENVKAAKAVELVLDEMLTHGYAPMSGDPVGPNADYVNAKNAILGAGVSVTRESQIPEELDAVPESGENATEPTVLYRGTEYTRSQFGDLMRSAPGGDQLTEAEVDEIFNQGLAISNPKQTQHDTAKTDEQTFREQQEQSVSRWRDVLTKTTAVKDVVLDDTLRENENAYYDKKAGVIHLNSKRATTEETMSQLVSHELVHSVKDDARKQLIEEIIGTLGNAEERERRVQELQERYQRHENAVAYQEGREARAIDADEATEEYAAMLVQEAFKSDEMLTKLAQEKPSLIQRVKQIIDDLVETLKGKADAVAERRELEALQTRFAEALKASAENEKNGAKYSLTLNEEAAILSYKSSESYKLNAMLRDGVTLDAYYEALRDDLDSGLKKLPTYQGRVYRVLNFGDIGGKEALDAFAAEHNVGVKNKRYKQYISASTVPNQERGKGAKYVAETQIWSENAHRMAGYGINTDNEVLFERDASFEVLAVHRTPDGKVRIALKENVNANTENGGNEHGGDLRLSQSNTGESSEGIQREMRTVRAPDRGAEMLRSVPGGYTEGDIRALGGLSEEGNSVPTSGLGGLYQLAGSDHAGDQTESDNGRRASVLAAETGLAGRRGQSDRRSVTTAQPTQASEKSGASSLPDRSYSLSADTEGRKLTRPQQEYFGKSKAMDEDGNLQVLYHGTVSDFTVFDRKFGNVENDMGVGFYFSNTQADVDTNYATEEGPDLKNKISRLAERIELEREIDYDKALEIARAELVKSDPRTLEVYVNTENPVVIGGEGETFFDFSEPYDEEYDEYGEPEGTLVDFIEALQAELREGDYSENNADVGAIWEEAYDGGLSAQRLIELVRERVVPYLEDAEGNLAQSEAIRAAFERMGFDGIIDSTVSEKFRMDGLNPDTKHVIVFNPEQVKLTMNGKPTKNPDIRFSLSADGDRVFHTPTGVEVVQNATDAEYRQMREDVLKQLPWLRGTGEPLLRHTYDEQGNEYHWAAHEAIHVQVEPYINEHYGTRTSQQWKWWEKPDKDDYPTDYKSPDRRYSITPEFEEWFKEGFSSESERSEVQKGLDDLKQRYGTIPAGEQPARNVEPPKQTADDQYVSKTARTVMEASATPERRLGDIKKAVIDGRFSHEEEANTVKVNAARNRIKRDGYDTALRDWTSDVQAGKVSADQVAMGAVLYNNAANSDMSGEQFVDLSVDYANLLTRAGRALQAARILKRLSPEGKLYGIQREVNKMNDANRSRAERKKGFDPAKWAEENEIKLDADLVEMYRKAQADEERDAIMEQIQQNVADQMPASLSEKLNNWRYLAMLGNFKTQGRNLLGNAAFQIPRLIKEEIAGGIEAVTQRSGLIKDRTRSAKRDAATYKAAWKDYENVRDIILNGSKLDEKTSYLSGIQEKRRIYNNAILEGYRRVTNAAMDMGDSAFCRVTYADSLASFMAANGTTWEKAPEALRERGRRHAIKEAAEATYRDNNALSETILKMRFKNPSNWVQKGVNAVVEGVLPFKKTPANVLARGVEYSPLGLIKTAMDGARVAKGGENVTGNDIINDLAKTITGSGLLAMGYFMAKNGLLAGGGPDDEKEKEFWELQGNQAYSIVWNGKSYTVDWLAPEAIPVLTGANLAEIAANEGWDLETVTKAVTRISDPMLEMSMLQGVNDTIENIANTQTVAALPSLILNSLWSYALQYVPTLFGQTERAADNTRRSTYKEAGSGVPGGVQYALGKLSQKAPGWDYNQIPYIDQWGRMENNYETSWGNAFAQFLSPSYKSVERTTEMENELQRLYDATGESGVLPGEAPKYLTVNGERRDLTGEEYVTYATVRGATAHDLLSDLTGSAAYRKLSDAAKVQAVSEVYSYARDLAKAEIFGEEIPDDQKFQPLDTSDYGVSAAEYTALEAAVKGFESLRYKDKVDDDGDAVAITNSKGLQIMEYVYANTRGLSKAEYEALFEALGVGKSIRKYSETIVQRKLKQMRKQAK